MSHFIRGTLGALAATCLRHRPPTRAAARPSATSTPTGACRASGPQPGRACRRPLRIHRPGPADERQPQGRRGRGPRAPRRGPARSTAMCSPRSTTASTRTGASPPSCPIVDRSHEHIHNHHGAKLLETWHFTQLGDIRVQGRYQTYFGEPTADRAGFARRDVRARAAYRRHRHHQRRGHRSPSARCNPGTGTTQAALSAYYREALPIHNSSWYVQGAAQLPLNYSRRLQARQRVRRSTSAIATTSTTGSASTCSSTTSTSTATRARRRSPRTPAGRRSRIAPGVTYAFTPAVQAYAFVAVPVYRYVNGVQLTSNWSAAGGVSMQF